MLELCREAPFVTQRRIVKARAQRSAQTFEPCEIPGQRECDLDVPPRGSGHQFGQTKASQQTQAATRHAMENRRCPA
jgi:hypothetical protein